MPAEWEPHEATWISWPRPEGISFPGAYDEVLPIFRKMVELLIPSEIVRINCGGIEKFVEKQLAGLDMSRVELVSIPTNEPWCRDHGPMFVRQQSTGRLAIVNWTYNAWGGKYPPYGFDDAVAGEVSERYGFPLLQGGMVLEGGAIDVDGQGSLLTTTSCLLHPNRNPDLTQAEMEKLMSQALGIECFVWLGDGIAGDDTDGHIDDMTRWVAPGRVVTARESNSHDPNFESLEDNYQRLLEFRTSQGNALEVFSMPMPEPLFRENQRLPASYANFYIANDVVLLPVFGDPQDQEAIGLLRGVFPDRTICPIDCRSLVWGLGAFHCLTQQQPVAETHS